MFIPVSIWFITVTIGNSNMTLWSHRALTRSKSNLTSKEQRASLWMHPEP